MEDEPTSLTYEQEVRLDALRDNPHGLSQNERAEQQALTAIDDTWQQWRQRLRRRAFAAAQARLAARPVAAAIPSKDKPLFLILEPDMKPEQFPLRFRHSAYNALPQEERGGTHRSKIIYPEYYLNLLKKQGWVQNNYFDFTCTNQDHSDYNEAAKRPKLTAETFLAHFPHLLTFDEDDERRVVHMRRLYGLHGWSRHELLESLDLSKPVTVLPGDKGYVRTAQGQINYNHPPVGASTDLAKLKIREEDAKRIASLMISSQRLLDLTTQETKPGERVVKHSKFTTPGNIRLNSLLCMFLAQHWETFARAQPDQCLLGTCTNHNPLQQAAWGALEYHSGLVYFRIEGRLKNFWYCFPRSQMLNMLHDPDALRYQWLPSRYDDELDDNGFNVRRGGLGRPGKEPYYLFITDRVFLVQASSLPAASRFRQKAAAFHLVPLQAEPIRYGHIDGGGVSTDHGQINKSAMVYKAVAITLAQFREQCKQP